MNAAFTGPRFSLLITSARVLATAPASLSQQVALYPSPAASGTVLLLELLTVLREQAISLTLVSSLGQMVQMVRLLASTSTAPRSFVLAGVAAGVYRVCLTTNLGLVTKRLVVE